MSKTKRRILHFLVTLNLIGLGTVGFIALTASKPHAQSGERRPECGHQSRLSALSIHLLTSLTTFAGLTPMLLESIDSTSIEQASLWFQIQQKKPDPPAWNFYLVFKQVLPVFPGRRLPDQCDRLTAVTM